MDSDINFLKTLINLYGETLKNPISTLYTNYEVTNLTKKASDQAAFVNAGFADLQKEADNPNPTCLFTNLQD